MVIKQHVLCSRRTVPVRKWLVVRHKFLDNKKYQKMICLRIFFIPLTQSLHDAQKCVSEYANRVCSCISYSLFMYGEMQGAEIKCGWMILFFFKKIVMY